MRRKKASRSERFAWLPTKMSNGTWVWLEGYRSINRRKCYPPPISHNVIDFAAHKDSSANGTTITNSGKSINLSAP